MSTDKKQTPLYIVLISVHGLIRGEDIELGKDADTGGQIKYVLELARALSENPQVGRVDLLTRQIFDKKVNPAYAEPEEQIADKAFIKRIPCGPRRYLRKEKLWPYLYGFVDHTIQYLRSQQKVPDIIHGHYADAGLVGSQLSRLLGVPFIFTGHSLGRVKKQRLLDKGGNEDSLESRYNFRLRIEAEETALDTAALVIASTHQEVEEQYKMYDNYQPQRMEVIAPGVDLSRFFPPKLDDPDPEYKKELARFLEDVDKPFVLAVARADERKNFRTLIDAYASTPALKEKANLVLIAGNRDSILKLDRGARKVMTEIFLQIDNEDLYGLVACPKHHKPEDIPELYRLAASQKGVFVNPALTEPFGLTLIEAAASGLPIVATNDGGPRDIVGMCNNGSLIDPLDKDDISTALLETLSNEQLWQERSGKGIEGSNKYYSWQSHVDRYLSEIQNLIKGRRAGHDMFMIPRSRLPMIDRIVITDVDNTLTGDDTAMHAFFDRLKSAGKHIGFGIATGRLPTSALDALMSMGIHEPDLLITCVGTEIYYGERLAPDYSWQNHINYYWNPDMVRSAMEEIPGLKLQHESYQRRFKVSFYVDDEKMPGMRWIQAHLRKKGLRVNLIYSHQAYLDVVPIRASTGLAIRYLAFKWGMLPEHFLIAGDSGNDEDMLSGNTLGVVVGNYSPELEKLKGRPRIYFAEGSHAQGILEGIDYYNFFDDIRIPEEKEESE